MNKPFPSIVESPAHLHQQLRREPDAKRRQRLQALYLVASGQARSRLALAQLLAVHRHTIHAWLGQPQGFGSYGEIQQYLAHDHKLSLAYSTVHALVRYKLQAKLKAPRRSHPKKNLKTLPSSRLRSARSSKRA